jgi:hypothetical protein
MISHSIWGSNVLEKKERPLNNLVLEHFSFHLVAPEGLLNLTAELSEVFA